MCPIPDEMLERHRYILMYDDETVMDAIVALRNADGQDWWRLIVDLETGGYAVGRFSDLSGPVEAQGADFLKRALGELVGEVLAKVDVVAEKAQTDADTIAEQAGASDSEVAVLTEGGEIQGIFAPSAALRKGVFESSLVSLAGQYSEIPKEGTLSRRRLGSKKKKGKPGVK